MTSLVSGRLLGIEETKLSLETAKGREILPRRELPVSLEWVFQNMGRPVYCRLEDGVVVEIAGARLQPSF